MKRHGLLGGAAAAAVAVALAAGCSAHGPAPAHTGAAQAHTKTPTSSTHSLAGAAKGTAAPSRVPNDVKARKNVAMSGCAGDKSSWHADGTAANTGKSPVTFRVTVFYTTQKATVVSWSSTTVTVPANSQEHWATSAKVTSNGQLRCVLTGVAPV